MQVQRTEQNIAGYAQWIASVRRAVAIESEGVRQLLAALDGPLGAAICTAIDTIKRARGRVILAGIGKSGYIARKIAATLASTGTPALFVHPAEASHGDLGMITTDDVVIMVSNSGESLELKDILAYSRRFAVPLIAITANPAGTLAAEADIVLLMPQAPEACPIGLAPTTSTLLQLALGDAIAVALLEDKGFNARQFRTFHPGGRLGAALTHLHAIMHKDARLPLVPPATRMAEALLVMTEKSFGCLGVTDEAGRLVGIITDGDLRRHMSKNLIDLPAGDVMTRSPKTMPPDALASEALEVLNSAKITSLFIVDPEGRPVGLVHIHDLLRLGVT
ncbi:MAG: KpsF/GutQ family sugar-phosphate isomerase [Rhizobiales bacterium]|nr:KpsF/GutQ family sugar-phosphate isomerase [Hyphomicrobiales bacterium]